MALGSIVFINRLMASGKMEAEMNNLGLWIGLWIEIGLCVAIVIGAYTQYRDEKKEWNNGVCKKCGTEWRMFDIDSQGGRMYQCKNGHYFDCSYSVDKRLK